MNPKIKLTDTGTFKLRKGGWYFQATIGPFNSQQEGYEFAREAAATEPEEVSLNALGMRVPGGVTTGTLTAPPALGINVSETITAKDKFG